MPRRSCSCPRQGINGGCSVTHSKPITAHCPTCGASFSITHGAAGYGVTSAEYHAWTSMKARCTNQNATNYRHYGGRGITVALEWMTSFEAFVNHVGGRPSKKHSLDRIDNNRGYEPGNVRWATAIEQAGNRRSSVPISHDGLTQSISAWGRTIGLPKRTLSDRLKNGWSVERALTTTRDARRSRAS